MIQSKKILETSRWDVAIQGRSIQRSLMHPFKNMPSIVCCGMNKLLLLKTTEKDLGGWRRKQIWHDQRWCVCYFFFCVHRQTAASFLPSCKWPRVLSVWFLTRKVLNMLRSQEWSCNRPHVAVAVEKLYSTSRYQYTISPSQSCTEISHNLNCDSPLTFLWLSVLLVINVVFDH